MFCYGLKQINVFIMKKFLIFALFCAFGSAYALADSVTITTSCGKTLSVDSSQLDNAKQAVDLSIAADVVLCGQ